MIVSSIDASNRTPSNKSFLVTELDKGVLTSDSGQTTAIGRESAIRGVNGGVSDLSVFPSVLSNFNSCWGRLFFLIG